jgi:hypothetical protein
MKIKFEWEEIANNEYRLKVINGWIYRRVEGYGNANMVFVPDKYHKWEIEK